jgi:acetyl esterase/lipase
MIDRRTFLFGSAVGLAGAGLYLRAILPAAAAPILNVSYGPNKLDIYPVANPGAPVVAYVHGGAWRLGSRGSVGSMPGYFNGIGYTFVSIGYSLNTNVGSQAAEVGRAVAWIKGNIATYGGDGERVALMGHSAGCQLSCLATLSGLAPPVRALIANDTAAYDVAYLAEINHGRLPFLYAQPFSDRSKWRQWSPYNFASGAAGMPVLVAWSGGENRDLVSRRFADALAAGGHPVTRFDGASYSHLSIRNAVGKRGDPLTVRITEFLSAYV